MGTGSIGLQIGAESAEMVALVLTEKGLNSFLSNSFKLGGDVSVAAGPVGAGTGAPITADMVVYVRAKGLYGGLNLSGSVITVDDDANRAFYGRPVTPVDILVKHTATNAAGKARAEEVARAASTGG
jgi:lipid-binding SYLF domain-containing protein